ncbi:MAG TPA: hypothetical protein GX529_00940, partial [Firmicutes bacterium]|nr:hypothetical protein [Candidatus Fermentithermobacillaceae bacterium]
MQFEAEKNAEFNRSIALSAVPQVTWEGKYYREFQLDINESERYISLDHFQLWWSPIQDPYDYSLSTYSFPSSMGMALLYDQTAEDAGATLKLDYMVNAGSGKRDYAILLPENMFGGRTEGYIVLFAEHGLTHTTDDGFEEWGVEVYAAPEQLTVAKTVNTEFTRTHKWLIDKWVETDNGDKLEDGTPKIWLLEGYNESEDAYWYVDVDYDGYEDSAHRVYGTVTIENTGTQDAVIKSVSDVLGETGVTVDFGVSFPYTLAKGAKLEGTYSESGEFKGNNVVTVTTEVDTYGDTEAIVWGAPASEVNETVHISDLSDLFGTVALGTVTAPNGDTFNYSKEFKRPDYSGEQHLTFNNTATIVETGQNDSVVLKVNKLDEELAVTKTVNTEFTRTHKWLIDKWVETDNGD